MKIDYGLRLEVDWSSTIGREIYFYGTYEPEISKFLTRFLQPKMIVVDAGANVGELTLRSAQRVGPLGRVYAIEASPLVFPRLCRNVSMNRLTNCVTPIHAAVSNVNGTTEFFVGTGVDSLGSSIMHAADPDHPPCQVNTIRLDSLLKSTGQCQVHLIKLDVEGAEHLALQGSEELLQLPHPPVIIFESNRAVMQSAIQSQDSILHYLSGFHYEFFRLRPNGSLIPMSPEYHLPSAETAKYDIVAIHPRSEKST